jgi:hypothetical protein
MSALRGLCIQLRDENNIFYKTAGSYDVVGVADGDRRTDPIRRLPKKDKKELASVRAASEGTFARRFA